MQLFSYVIDNLSHGITAFGTPIFYVLVLAILGHFSPVFALRVLVLLLCVEVAGALIKLFYPTERPIPRPHTTIIERYDAGSFPSIHSARAGVLASVFAMEGHDVWLTCVFLLVAIGVGWSRMRLGHHRFADVLGGYGLALFFSFILSRVW